MHVGTYYMYTYAYMQKLYTYFQQSLLHTFSYKESQTLNYREKDKELETKLKVVLDLVT